MTRETKIGMAVAGSFLSLVGAVVGTKIYKGDIPEQPLEGLVANLQDGKKEHETGGNAKPQSPPGTLPVGFLNTNPMPPNSSGFPQTPPDNIVPPAPPLNAGPNFDGMSLPKPPDPTVALNNTVDDITKTLELQKKREEERLRNAYDQSKKEVANAGNTIIDGVNKNVGQFKDALQKNTQNAIDSLPTLPPADPSNLTLPPFNVADNTIVGGKKPNDPLPAPPSAPKFNGVPPGGNETPKTTIVGGKPDVAAPTMPPAAPNFSPQKETVPSAPPFGNEPKLPSIPTASPPGSDLPPIPKDPFPPANSPLPPIGNPPNGSPLPSSPPTEQNPFKPAIETPPTTIVAPRPNVDPLTPPANSTPPNNPFPSSPPSTSPQGNGFVPQPTSPPPFDQAAPPKNPSPPPFDPSAPPANPGFTPLVQPTPVVKTDSSRRYTCQGNENYALISFREYGNENYARALEEYNRDLPTASEGVRAQPARLMPGTVIMVPSQNYLATHERYARLVSNGSNLPPVASPTSNPRPFGNDIGISQPMPNNNAPRPTTTADAGTTSYRVPAAGMYLSQVAERQLGSALRWIDIYRLNPGLQPEQPLREGMEIRIPAK